MQFSYTENLMLIACVSFKSTVSLDTGFVANLIHKLLCFLCTAQVQQVFNQLNAIVDTGRIQFGADMLEDIVLGPVVTDQITGDKGNE